MIEIVPKEIDDYCKEYSISDSDILSKLKLSTWETEDNPQMISGELIGGLLQILIKISNAKTILEIGMFTGYSALKMAEALPADGTIDCCEIESRHTITAKKWFTKSKYDCLINVHKGLAIKTMKNFKPETFDLMFIDADKPNYPHYQSLGFSLLRPGGIAVFDNMLWSGTVLNPCDDESNALRETAELIKNNPRLDPLLLPVRDGVMVYRKIK